MRQNINLRANFSLLARVYVTVVKSLQLTIDGEIYEYTKMHPSFHRTAEKLAKAQKCFAAPDKVQV